MATAQFYDTDKVDALLVGKMSSTATGADIPVDATQLAQTIAEAISENADRLDQIESALDYILDDSESEEGYWGLTFTAEEPNSTVAMTKVVDAPSVSLETSVDGGLTWHPFIIGETVITLANVGDSVCFQAGDGGTGGDGLNIAMGSLHGSNVFNMTGRIAASGDVSSLLDRRGTVTDLTGRTYCYASLFNDLEFGSKALVSAPELPATTLADSCYSQMFYCCESLSVAPELPAISLAESCYDSMFYGCSSLTEAPELPAEALASECYAFMFYYCVALAHVKVRFAAWNPANATEDWLDGTPTPAEETPCVFECPADLDTETIRDVSHVPEGWEVVKF